MNGRRATAGPMGGASICNAADTPTLVRGYVSGADPCKCSLVMMQFELIV